MTYQPFPIDQFPGLDLRTDTLEAGCMDASNVDIGLDGKVKGRDGWGLVWANASPVAQVTAFKRYGNPQHALFVDTGGTIRAVDNYGTGPSLATAATAATYPTARFAAIGTITGEFIYYSGGTGATTVLRWNGSAFTSPAALATYAGQPIAVTPIDNRLVFANHDVNGRVVFSNPGAPETITYTSGPPATGDFVDLALNDGEAITELVVWRDLLFAFKSHKFFVFYGTSTDSTGGAIFNYRAVTSGQGASDLKGLNGGTRACAARDGVYFVNASGVWRTTGDTPQRISRQLGPYETAIQTVGTDGSRVFASDYTQTFVFDVELQTWTRYGLAINCAAPFTEGSGNLGATRTSDSLIFGTDTQVAILGGGRTTDASGSTITGYYQTGFKDFGVGDQKVIRQIAVEGSGSVTFIQQGETGAVQSTGALTLSPPGSEATVVGTMVRDAFRARLWSLKIQGTNVWYVSKVTPYIREARRRR